MQKLQREDLMTLERYSQERPSFRSRVIAHKKHRTVGIGPNITLIFEDRLTIQYQIQEMLRIERIFEAEAIEEELEAYNPLIPDGANLKATLMIEFPEPTQRALELIRLKGIEDRVFARVGELAPSFAIADEDLDRSDEHKTSAVHFLRFELSGAQIAALRGGASLTLGVDDTRYPHAIVLSDAHRQSLIRDLA